MREYDTEDTLGRHKAGVKISIKDFLNIFHKISD